MRFTTERKKTSCCSIPTGDIHYEIYRGTLVVVEENDELPKLDLVGKLEQLTTDNAVVVDVAIVARLNYFLLI